MPSKHVFSTLADAVKSAQGDYFEGNVAQTTLFFFLRKKEIPGSFEATTYIVPQISRRFTL